MQNASYILCYFLVPCSEVDDDVDPIPTATDAHGCSRKFNWLNFKTYPDVFLFRA